NPILYIYLIPGFYCQTNITNIYKMFKAIVVNLIISKNLQNLFYIIDERYLKQNFYIGYDLNNKNNPRAPFSFDKEYLKDETEYKSYITIGDKNRKEDIKKQTEFQQEKFKNIDTKQDETKEKIEQFERDTMEQFNKTQDDILNGN